MMNIRLVAHEGIWILTEYDASELLTPNSCFHMVIAVVLVWFNKQ